MVSFQKKNLSAHVHRDLLRKVAVGDRRRNLRDVANLAGQIRGHGVHVVGEVLPGPCDAGHLCLATQLAICPHLSGNASDFAGEGVQLIHHRVDGVFRVPGSRPSRPP